MNREITKAINDKYPVYGSIASNQVTNIVARQAAQFGVELGLELAIEFAEWKDENTRKAVGRNGKAYHMYMGDRKYYTTEQIFTIFKQSQTEQNDHNKK